MPDVLDMSEPPIIDKNKKYKLIFWGGLFKVIPELLKLLATLINTWVKFKFSIVKYIANAEKIINDIRRKSSLCSEDIFLLLNILETKKKFITANVKETNKNSSCPLVFII